LPAPATTTTPRASATTIRFRAGKCCGPAGVAGGYSLTIVPLPSIRSSRSRLLAGYRGAPPLDAAALIDLITAVSDMTSRWPAGFELDLNPVLVLPDGVRVLDAAYIPATPQPDR
jgi:hypothetical protein